MKTIRLLYPDYLSGGLETYHFGAKLLSHMLPENASQPLFAVDVAAPGKRAHAAQEGINDLKEIVSGMRSAAEILERERPERIITIGGNCIVSLVPFDYLHALYPDAGIVWIDAHPDVSTPEDGYPFAHAMVLGSLLGSGAAALRKRMKSAPFDPQKLLYVGLQDLHDYQQQTLKELGVDFQVQTERFVEDEKIVSFARKSSHLLVHLDIDVLDPRFFHSTYFANPELVGDGSGGGKMSIEKLSQVLGLIFDNAEVVGLTLAEYLPFDEERLSRMLSGLPVFH